MTTPERQKVSGELTACPFCGKKDLKNNAEYHPFTSFWIECRYCGARGPREQGNTIGVEGRESGRKRAVKAWNGRIK